MFSKILVPVDGSTYSKKAVEVAIDLAKRYEASILLLHVIRNLSLPTEILAMIASGEVTESRMELLQDSAEIILEDAKEKCAQADFLKVSGEYLMGEPALVITDYAKQKKVDLIVIGYRGLEVHEGRLLGGVARKLTNISETTCLVVK